MSANLPYKPFKALLSPQEDSLVYILRPPSSDSTSSQLLLLNTTETIHSSALPFVTVTSQLPFLEDGTDVDYISAMDGTGTIHAYAGSCSGGVDNSDLWQFRPSGSSISTGGEWTKIHVSRASTGKTELEGANKLAAGVAFSPSNTAAAMYVFGGMCPNATVATNEDWTQTARYSNSMLALEPDVSSNTENYSLTVSSSRGPPIPEAGFTMTPLLPSFTRTDVADGSQQMAQNYVLLGGHTQAAFINMSQVALFSLPEQSWTFLPVDSPIEEPATELTIRNGHVIEPRSGHTAVLSADGKSIVVYGGWVGDIGTAAHPQLAILRLGEGYGGEVNWKWALSEQTGAGIGPDAGLYGHGAVMLPGNVMMIVGGYSIPDTGNPRYKRADIRQNNNNYFFNTTSSTWIDQYTHPRAGPGGSTTAKPTSQSITAAKRAGLGAGLVFGVLALLAIVVLYFWYTRRLRRKKDTHEEDLRNIGSGGQRAHSSVLLQNARPSEMTMHEPGDAYPWGVKASTGQAMIGTPRAQRTGLLFEIPSPTRGLRRSLHSRGVYQPAPRYDDGRAGGTSGDIHPIDERDEYEEVATIRPSSSGGGLTQRGDYHILESAPVLDPFQDPSEQYRTSSPPSPAWEREREVQKWVNDWAAADARMHQQAGRLSPDKTDRTSSTLSEQSMRSTWSGHSIGSFSRSLSQRSAALFSHAYNSTNATTAPSPANDLQNATQSKMMANSRHRRSQSLTLDSQRATAPNTMMPRAGSFRQLQQESEVLLGGCADAGSSSPTRGHGRARGWMGSMRRAFGVDSSGSTSPELLASSASSSPTKLHPEARRPRRAASAGAALWQRRQGAKDWDVGDAGGDKRTNTIDGPGTNDEEWDVESAIERRVVQVMFTVPREKLRVVNGAPEGDGESVLSNEVKDAEMAAEGKGKEKELGE
ncbi:MAG: hypothetical protein L6R38_002519 [Xanthoria sp. 2 TBL-2021]|nr:MAG: hypothetical protein L6R38_002519 [Xanthoria sp. 2 TBL-2021]